MQSSYVFICDDCGFSKERPSMCPQCKIPLTIYSKLSQRKYAVSLAEAVRSRESLKWYFPKTSN